ncbi:MAG: hypothetical protein J0H39_03865 [Alphaproteobacteria bacterium]|nr:hypothetical protein [Alphaproteobacteria bacterium]
MPTVEKLPSPSQVAQARARLEILARSLGDLRATEAQILAERRSLMPLHPRDHVGALSLRDLDGRHLSVANKIRETEEQARELAAVVEDHDRREAITRAREQQTQDAQDRTRAAELAAERIEIARTIDAAISELAKAFADFERVGIALSTFEHVTGLASQNLRAERSVKCALAAQNEALARLLGFERFAHGDPRPLAASQAELLARIVPPAVIAAE